MGGSEQSRSCHLWRRMKEAVVVDVSLVDRNRLILEAYYEALLSVNSLQVGHLSFDKYKHWRYLLDDSPLENLLQHLNSPISTSLRNHSDLIFFYRSVASSGATPEVPCGTSPGLLLPSDATLEPGRGPTFSACRLLSRTQQFKAGLS